MNLSELLKMYDFTGRSIVITGGTGVLCGAMAKSLVGCGANVAILARNVEKGEALLAEMDGPGRAVIVRGDVLDQESLQAATRATLDEFGRIDGLINGAGGNSPQATTRPDLTFFNLPEEALRYVFDLNMLGTILPCQVFGRQMAEQGEGVILNVSSMSAMRVTIRSTPFPAPPTRALAVFLLVLCICGVLFAALFPFDFSAPGGDLIGKIRRDFNRSPWAPTLEDRDRLIVNKLRYRLWSPQRGDIVMLYYPLNPDKSFVKRVIAEEGDEVRIVDGRVYVNDVPLPDDFVPPEYRSHDDFGPTRIQEGYYFVMGDHRNNSSDSRHWGMVPKMYIIGRVQLRWWPIPHARVF